jgi:hypothetical protein
LVTVHIPAEAGLGFSLVESFVPEGQQQPLHLHRTDDEGFYLLEGRLTIWVWGSPARAQSRGLRARAPRRSPYLPGGSAEGARWLVTSSDASFDRFVRAYGEPATDAVLPEPVEPDLERLAALAQQHGIEILGPPGTLPN